MKIKNYLWIFLLNISIGGILFSIKSAPHNGEIFELEQPDGSTVTVKVWGDEFYQRVESLEGYTLVRNKKGWICYAKLSPDSSELISTDIIYRNTLDTTEFKKKGESLPINHIKLPRKYRLKKHQSVRRALLKDSVDISPAPTDEDTTDSGKINLLPGVTPITGNFVGLTILVDFSDKEKSIPIDSVEDFLNKRGYTGYKNNGSVRDYFFDVSGGKVDYTNKLFGYYRAKNPKSYYDNSSVSFGTRAMELVLEALNWVKSQGFDFSTLSTDSRKRILAINVLYAGTPSQGWSQGLWPHQGTVSGFTANGVTARKYQISALGSGLTIGTFCHENGHMLFNWPDLYDYGGESSGVGNYCIMCATGSTNPVPPCAYLRDFSGWDAVTDITDMVIGTVLSIIPNTNTSFVYRNKSNSNEMFYIEARRRVGRSRALPDSGFMIWHVDRAGSNNNEGMTPTSHYLVSLEQADNLFELEKGINSGKVGDLFRKGYKDRFDDSTQPSAKWWNGSNSNMKIWNMSGVGDTMSFSIGEIKGTVYNVIVKAGEHGFITPSGQLSAVGGTTLRFIIKPDSGYQIEEIIINGISTKITDTLVIEKINSNYEVKVVFGLKSVVSILYPTKGDVLYAGDTVTLRWRLRSQAVEGYNISYSIDGGENFIPLVNNLSKNDSLFKWKVPVIESDSCIIKISDLDGTPSVNSEIFSIRKRPLLSIASEMINITVEKGKIKEYTLPFENKGSGELRISATTARQVKKVFINELSVGTDSTGPDGIEIFNSGTDIDLSGWHIEWEDNKTTSGEFFFPEGFILKGGSAIFLSDRQSDTMGNFRWLKTQVQWLYSDSLVLSVSLLDASGRGVDFVKSKGSTVQPPEGITWKGEGVNLCGSFIVRTSVLDNDTASDWKCVTKGTLGQLNEGQKLDNTQPLILVTPLNSKIGGNQKSSLSININATNISEGNYTDMIVIYHNDPLIPSPVRIPCMITVSPPSSVVASKPVARRENIEEPIFGVFPNPLPAGSEANFIYKPSGNERKGVLKIYNNIGNCIYSKQLDFSSVNVFNRTPIIVKWLPNSKIHLQTCIAFLIIESSNGKKNKLSTKIAIK